MQNTHQIVAFPANVLVNQKIPEAVHAKQNEFVEWDQKGKHLKKEINAKRAEIIKLIPPKLKAELKSFNVELPMDKVDVNMKLGSLFYDLYYKNCKS